MVLHAHELDPAIPLGAELHLGELNTRQRTTTHSSDGKHT